MDELGWKVPEAFTDKSGILVIVYVASLHVSGLGFLIASHLRVVNLLMWCQASQREEHSKRNESGVCRSLKGWP